MEICRAKLVTNSLKRRARDAWMIIGLNECVLLAFGRSGLEYGVEPYLAATAIRVMRG